MNGKEPEVIPRLAEDVGITIMVCLVSLSSRATWECQDALRPNPEDILEPGFPLGAWTHWPMAQ